jgi:hypothetical protein
MSRWSRPLRPGGERAGERRADQGDDAMKYMLMMFGDAETMLETRSKEWVTEMIEFMRTFNADLDKAGELVAAHGLAYPGTAKTVSLVDGQVVVTDGPFAEAKESLAGFWILDVADEARAVELAGKVLPYAQKVELREVPDTPPEV